MPKNLIYGYNGYGKTTISRIMSLVSGKQINGLKKEGYIEINYYKQDLTKDINTYLTLFNF